MTQRIVIQQRSDVTIPGPDALVIQEAGPIGPRGPRGESAEGDPLLPSDFGVFDPDTQPDAIEEAANALMVPEELLPALQEAIAAVNIEHVENRNGIVRNSSKLAANAFVGLTLLGINVNLLTNIVNGHLSIGPNIPPEPSDPTKAIWVAINPADLDMFVDFRKIRNGPVPNRTNGHGRLDPVEMLSFHNFEGNPAFQPCMVIDGAAQSDMVTGSSEVDPTPKTGFGFIFDPGLEGRIEWLCDGVLVRNPDIQTYVPTNIAISTLLGQAYLIGIVYGPFDEGADTSTPGNPISVHIRIIKDVFTAPSTIAWAEVPNVPLDDDGYPDFSGMTAAMTYNAAGTIGGWVDNVKLVEITDTQHPIADMEYIGMPLHVGGAEGYEWEHGPYLRVAAFGKTGGSPVNFNIGVHRWVEGKWRPVESDSHLVFPPYQPPFDPSEFESIVDDRIATLIGSAPDALNSIEELAAAYQSDNDTIVEILSALLGKQNASSELDLLSVLSTQAFGRVLLEKGDANAARTYLNVDSAGTATTEAAKIAPRLIVVPADAYDRNSGGGTFGLDTSCFGDGYMQGTPANGDWLEYDHYLSVGNWMLSDYHTLATTHAIVQWYLDGTAIGLPINGYASATTRNQIYNRYFTVTTPGLHTLKLLTTGRDPSGVTTYRMGLQKYYLKRI